MVLLRQRVHPRGLSLAMQRKVYVRRTVHKESWEVITPQIKNLKGKIPCWQVCRDTFNRMLTDRSSDGYGNCGPEFTITPALRKWLVSRLPVSRHQILKQISSNPKPLVSYTLWVSSASHCKRILQYPA